jgi:hypothetical protein
MSLSYCQRDLDERHRIASPLLVDVCAKQPFESELIQAPTCGQCRPPPDVDCAILLSQ